MVGKITSGTIDSSDNVGRILLVSHLARRIFLLVLAASLSPL